MNSLDLNQSIQNSNLVELSLDETRMTAGGFAFKCLIAGAIITVIGAVVDLFDGDGDLGDDIRQVGAAVSAFGSVTSGGGGGGGSTGLGIR